MAKKHEFDFAARKPARTYPWLVAIFSTQLALLITFLLLNAQLSG